MEQRLNHYRILGKVGSGGMATVYQAQDTRSGTIVAIKIMHPHLAEMPQYIERFRKEARIAQTLVSPNIVRVLDQGDANGIPYLVMEFVQGVTLQRLLQEQGALSQEQAVDVAAQVAEALEVAYQKQILHRDIKPQNVMITPQGLVKVMDFGIAKEVGAAALTQTGIFMGTPQYVSPEQAAGRPVDVRSDIYSLGVVLYQMLAGVVPFRADTPWAIMVQHVETPPVPVHRLRVDVLSEVEAIVNRALEKDPAKRFQVPSEMAAALRTLQRPEVPMAVRDELATIVSAAPMNANFPMTPVPGAVSVTTPTPGGQRVPTQPTAAKTLPRIPVWARVGGAMVGLLAVAGVIVGLAGRGGSETSTPTTAAIAATPPAAPVARLETLPADTPTPPPADTPTPTPTGALTPAGTAAVIITKPQPSDALRGRIDILGAAAHPDFDRYELTYAREPAENSGWVLILDSHNQVPQVGLLGNWDTTTVADGAYALRLRVIRRDGNYDEKKIAQVQVVNAPTLTVGTPAATATSSPTATLTPTLTRQLTPSAVVSPSVTPTKGTPTATAQTLPLAAPIISTPENGATVSGLFEVRWSWTLVLQSNWRFDLRFLHRGADTYVGTLLTNRLQATVNPASWPAGEILVTVRVVEVDAEGRFTGVVLSRESPPVMIRRSGADTSKPPTNTPAPKPATDTPMPIPTNTLKPATDTPKPPPTSTPKPPTNTPVPPPTSTPRPPTNTPVPPPTHTPRPPTDTPVPPPTDTPRPPGSPGLLSPQSTRGIGPPLLLAVGLLAAIEAAPRWIRRGRRRDGR